MKLRLGFLFFFWATTMSSSFGQVLDSISTSQEDGMVVVRFDFMKGDPGVEYELYLYGSHDNFQRPLQETTGDVGKGIRIGAGKVIYWNAEKELGNFKGDFSLKIKGQKYIPIVEFKNVQNQLKLKRGQHYNFQWKPNSKSSLVLLTIKKGGIPIVDPAIVENSGEFDWFIPKDLKPGKNITIEISDPDNLLRKETSAPFAIRRRIPLAAKIIPAMAIVGGISALLFIIPENNEIPAPPEAPNFN